MATILSIPSSTPQAPPHCWGRRPCPPRRRSTLAFSTSLPTSSPPLSEDEPPPPPISKAELPAPPRTEDPSFRGCKVCGKEEIEKGCNGEGRIQGGIAAIPGFRWWPIKAFRPCPGFVASGGRYRRRGQSMDEVVSGGAK